MSNHLDPPACSAKLSASLPDGEGNGLQAIARQLAKHPEQAHIALVILDCKATSTDNDTGVVTATARVKRIEPITFDKPMLLRMMDRAQEARTGKTVLPFEAENEIRSVFEGVDPDTGEIKGG